MGVGVAGLAALTGGEHPHPGRQFGRHVHHRLALAQESLGDVTADPGKSLDPPLRPDGRELEHRVEPRVRHEIATHRLE
ncbi:hypothetical protein [Propioniciclava sinopodophylli]|uniref:hypothetical protein n=1 Tax=Propioniciclava sinopodophylli TaxID=1837344 RepID=UPI0013F17CB9|nr:hypothetical protein [Propioniciclava sinopodophylli]